MRKLTVMLMVVSLMLVGVAVALAADAPQTQQKVALPQALQGVDLSKAKTVSAKEAQEVRGAACMDFSHDYLRYPDGGLQTDPISHDYLGTKWAK